MSLLMVQHLVLSFKTQRQGMLCLVLFAVSKMPLLVSIGRPQSACMS